MKEYLVDTKLESEDIGEPISEDDSAIQRRLEAQDAVWHKYTDEEIAAIRKELYVNKTADVGYSRPGILQMVLELGTGLSNAEIFKKMVSMSKNNRLLELGSGTTLYQNFYQNFFPEMGQADKEAFIGSGIREYIGVDLGAENFEWTEEVENQPEKKEQVSFKYVNEEILTACRSFPEDYGNVWLTGIERGDVIRNYRNWGLALLSEFKRVVPQNGFIVTDHCFMDDILERVSRGFKEFEKSARQDDVEKLKNWEISSDDLFFPKGSVYKVGIPEIGFDVYLPKQRYQTDTPMVIINKQKERPGK